MLKRRRSIHKTTIPGCVHLLVTTPSLQFTAHCGQFTEEHFLFSPAPARYKQFVNFLAAMGRALATRELRDVLHPDRLLFEPTEVSECRPGTVQHYSTKKLTDTDYSVISEAVQHGMGARCILGAPLAISRGIAPPTPMPTPRPSRQLLCIGHFTNLLAENSGRMKIVAVVWYDIRISCTIQRP